MDLIAVEQREIIEGSPVDTVNARDLWEFLESKQEFANWIRARIEQCGLVEGEDYLIDNSVNQVPHQGGLRQASRFERFVTIEAAKHLGMIERNARGRQIRQWFIDREKALRTIESAGVIALDLNNPASVLQTVEAFARRLASEREKVVHLEHVVTEQTPKVEAFDLLETGTDGSFCLRDAAKHFTLPERKFIAWLQQKQWIYKRIGNRDWLSYAERLKQGYLEHRIRTFKKPSDPGVVPAEDGMSTQVRITARGMAQLAKVFATKDVDASGFKFTLNGDPDGSQNLKQPCEIQEAK